MATKRKSYGNVNCEKINPVVQTKKEMANLKTVAFRLTNEQAIDLAKKLLGAAQNSQVVDVTGFRLRNMITVTVPPT